MIWEILEAILAVIGGIAIVTLIVVIMIDHSFRKVIDFDEYN